VEVQNGTTTRAGFSKSEKIGSMRLSGSVMGKSGGQAGWVA
jgi:hypothetical protein